MPPNSDGRATAATTSQLLLRSWVIWPVKSWSPMPNRATVVTVKPYASPANWTPSSPASPYTSSSMMAHTVPSPPSSSQYEKALIMSTW
jgi:hypothetical protein